MKKLMLILTIFAVSLVSAYSATPTDSNTDTKKDEKVLQETPKKPEPKKHKKLKKHQPKKKDTTTDDTVTSSK